MLLIKKNIGLLFILIRSFFLIKKNQKIKAVKKFLRISYARYVKICKLAPIRDSNIQILITALRLKFL